MAIHVYEQPGQTFETDAEGYESGSRKWKVVCDTLNPTAASIAAAVGVNHYDPHPQRADLAIEVEWARGAVDRLDVYRKLGVKEVWIWRKNQVEVFRLEGERYAPVDGSQVLAGLDLRQLVRFIDIRPTQTPG